MACKGWLGNATSTGSSGIVAAAFHSTATNAKSYKTQLKSFEVYRQSFLHFVRALICFGKPSRLTNAPVGKRWTNQKVWGSLLTISMVRSMCSNIAREWQRQNALTVTMSLCPYVIVCDVSYFFFQQPLHIVTTSWMILSNAGHGLQRLARKRNFHRLVWHSGCCLSFNGHKREILQDTIEVIWNLLSILPAFCEGTDLFWKAKSVDKCSGGLKVNKPKSVGKFIDHFHGPQYVFKYCQRMSKTKCTDCVTMPLCPYVIWLLLSAAIARSYY